MTQQFVMYALFTFSFLSFLGTVIGIWITLNAKIINLQRDIQDGSKDISYQKLSIEKLKNSQDKLETELFQEIKVLTCEINNMARDLAVIMENLTRRKE